jgi:hypothetical protein
VLRVGVLVCGLALMLMCGCFGVSATVLKCCCVDDRVGSWYWRVDVPVAVSMC